MISNNRVLLAMSGGIDSTASAVLLLEEGYEVIGLTLRMYEPDEIQKNADTFQENKPAEASYIAEQLNIKHYTLDVRKKFEETIIQNFENEYFSGRTPNPCVLCNRQIKWEFLRQKAIELDCQYIATGHYARLAKNSDGFFSIYKAKDTKKDQSYFLYGLNQDFLQMALFPLGDYEKNELKNIVNKYNLSFLNHKKESMEICFIPENNYRKFLRKRNPSFFTNLTQGDFISTKGEYLGKHKGYPFYTIGQRKGLDIALGYPAYVVEIMAGTNTIVLGKREELYSKRLTASQINFISPTIPELPKKVTAKVRYNHDGTPALLYKIYEKYVVEFEKPVFAITPGQSLVLYENDRLLGGGLIE